MQIGVQTTFQPDRKEALSALLERIHDAFVTAGIVSPELRFTFSDSPVPRSVSPVERACKRFPALSTFLSDAPEVPGGPPMRRLTNRGRDAHPVTIDIATLFAVAQGVPRTFPFHSFAVTFSSPEFGGPLAGRAAAKIPGVEVTDSSWVNGRIRSLTALVLVEAEPSQTAAPELPATVRAIIAACGKVKGTVQVPLSDGASTPLAAASSSTPQAAIAEVVRDFRARLGQIVQDAALPHTLPPFHEALRTSVGVSPGARKPVLDWAFKPLGYDCKAGSGTFSLRRRTQSNLTVEIALDVGTWSRMVTALYIVRGLDVRATLPLPVTKGANASQYPIGDGEQWQRIVDNLATLVAELDGTFVPAIEAVAAPTPEWFQPGQDAG